MLCARLPLHMRPSLLLSSACPGSVSEDSSTSACNTNQTRAGCVDDEGFTSLKYNTFLPGGYIACALRGGNAAKGRPIPTSEDSCPPGTVLCGGTAGATWDANRATCQPSSSDCPVMFLDYIDTPSSAPAGVTLRTVPGTGKSFALYKTLPSSVPANFSSVGVGPLVNLPIAKDGKVCLASSKPIVSEEGRNLQNAYTSCSGGGDPRYKQVLQRPIFDLFNHTVQTSSSSVCVSNPNDRVSFSGGRSCGTGDSLCQRIITNSQCEKLEEYVQNSRTQGSWDVMYRSEVYWSSDCPVPRKEVEKNVSPINDALDLQYALMVVNILFNVLSGFLIPILLIYNAWAGDVPCVPYEGQAEKNLIKFIKVWFSAGSKIGKLIPMVIVLVLIRGMLGFLERLDKVSSEQCSDPTTTRSFEGISSTLQDAYNSNTRTALPMDVIGLLMALFNIYRELTDGVALKDK